MRKFVFIALLVFVASALQAQDKIYRKNGQVVLAKVIEIGTTEIKYKLPNDIESPIYVLEKDRISKIEYENGKVEKFTPDLKDPEQYVGQLRKAIKIDFLGPLLGYSQVTYEKSTGIGKGYEVTLGVIGAGKNQTIEYFDNTLQATKRNQFGFAAGVGYKFNKLPNFLFGKPRLTHIMQGSYAKPVVYVGNYSENRIYYKGNQYIVERDNTTFGALQIELGRQWVFGDKFLLDTFWGLGYGFDNKSRETDIYNDDYSAYNYINARLGRSPGLQLPME